MVNGARNARGATRSVIVSAVRTPFGRFGGGLAHLRATALGSIAIQEALCRAGITADAVDYVIMGQVLQGGAGAGPARQAALGADVPAEVPAETINKLCASGLRAVAIADSMIRSGEATVVVAGGMESMSRAPHALLNSRVGYRLGDGALVDLALFDGLVSPFDGQHMVIHASMVSEEFGIAREDQDAWALRSHERAVRATEAGILAEEIIPVGDVLADESPRSDTSLEKLSRLPSVFDPTGTTTAGNAPGLNDGAAALVITSEEWAARHGLQVLATIISQAHVAGAYAYLAPMPARAAEVALERAGARVEHLRQIEINEAFSSVALHSTRMLGADPDLVNPNGGAVALGHPIGASGARILTTLVHGLRRSGGGLGLAAICSGGGQGDALLLEVQEEAAPEGPRAPFRPGS